MQFPLRAQHSSQNCNTLLAPSCAEKTIIRDLPSKQPHSDTTHRVSSIGLAKLDPIKSLCPSHRTCTISHNRGSSCRASCHRTVPTVTETPILRTEKPERPSTTMGTTASNMKDDTENHDPHAYHHRVERPMDQQNVPEYAYQAMECVSRHARWPRHTASSNETSTHHRAPRKSPAISNSRH